MSVTIGRRSLFMGTIAALVAGTFSGTLPQPAVRRARA